VVVARLSQLVVAMMS